MGAAPNPLDESACCPDSPGEEGAAGGRVWNPVWRGAPDHQGLVTCRVLGGFRTPSSHLAPRWLAILWSPPTARCSAARPGRRFLGAGNRTVVGIFPYLLF